MPRRRWWWIGALLALALLLVSLLAPSGATRWVGASTDDVEADLARTHLDRARFGPGSGGARGAVLTLDAGVARFAPADGGPRERARRLRGHLSIDACEEPLPEGPIEAPEDRAVEALGAVRVAYAPEWLDRRAARELAADVDAALAEAAALLGSEKRRDLLVVTWPDREAMTDAMETASWAQAMYDGSVHVAADASARSVRHEVLHAQLHATAPCVPYWLDEGLAAYFEGDPGTRAITWLRMIRTPIWIPFDSLAEPLRDDEGADEMDPAEVSLLYAQSLAMTTMLVESPEPGALERALAASNAGTSRRDLWQRAVPDVDGVELIDFLARRLFPDLDAGERARLDGAGFVCDGPGPDGLPRCEPFLAGRAPLR